MRRQILTFLAFQLVFLPATPAAAGIQAPALPEIGAGAHAP